MDKERKSRMVHPYVFSDGALHDYSKQVLPESYFVEVLFPFLYTYIQEFGVQNDTTFVDIGGGTGDITKIARHYGFKAINLDFCFDGLEHESQTFPLAKCVQGDAHFLPFPDNTIAILHAKDVLVHIKDYQVFFTECYRVLKRGGKMLVVSTFGLNHHPDYVHNELFETMDFITDSGLDIATISSWGPKNIEIKGDWYNSTRNSLRQKVSVHRAVIEIVKP